MRGLGEAPSHRDLYAIGIELPGVAAISTRVIGDPDEPVVLIGRDVPNLFRITFDGPNRTTEFH